MGHTVGEEHICQVREKSEIRFTAGTVEIGSE
jgi:hypothetical protein